MRHFRRRQRHPRAWAQSHRRRPPGAPIDTKIFLTHFHWDHIQGIPFFAPLYGPKNHISFFSGKTGRPLQETLEGQMAQPYFPIDFSQVAAKRDFHPIDKDDAVKAGRSDHSPVSAESSAGRVGVSN